MYIIKWFDGKFFEKCTVPPTTKCKPKRNE